MTPAGVAVVARHELRLRIRAGRWRWLLGAFFLVLLAFTAMLRAGVESLAPSQAAYRGTVVYGGLMLFVLALALLVVPALAAQSVNGDRERGTLAVLQVTRLSAGDIAVGKLAAAWGTALVFLLLTAPFVGYAMTQSGVPVMRVVVVTLVLTLLLGSVCSISLWLSAVLSRTTTSGVLAYLVVFGLTVGTLVLFGLTSAVTAERTQQVVVEPCPVPEPTGTPGPLVPGPNGFPPACGTTTVEYSRWRTERTWWLLAPNPFVVLADAAPRLPEVRGAVYSTTSLDPLGMIGRGVRGLRAPAPPTPPAIAVLEPSPLPAPADAAVWPTGMAMDVLAGVAALLLTVRRLRTPSRRLPRGQRVA